MKTKKYALTYIPSDNGFAVTELKPGVYIKKKYLKNTTIIRAESPKKALKKLSERSYRLETGKKLR